jgi:hypothetical protein
LFAPSVSASGHGQRPTETLRPLAERLKVPIATPLPAREYGALAERLLHDPTYEGKTIVVCWVHDSLPSLAKKLGIKPEPEPWNAEVFDRVWVITYRKHHARLTTLDQRLLPGDTGYLAGGQGHPPRSPKDSEPSP